MSKKIDVTLDNCHKEPIHIPGSIQPHGYLIAAEPQNLTLKYCSENLADLLGISLAKLIGSPIKGFVDETFITLLATYNYKKKFHVTNPQTIELKKQTGEAVLFDTVLTFSHGLLIIELEVHKTSVSASFNPVKDLINLSLNNLADGPDLSNVFSKAVKEVRRITGFDRVMLYRFDADYNGEVIAEAKKKSLNSFLKQHFPESDIPKQARELYIKNPIRLLADVDAEQSLLYPQDKPVDLSDCILRSVSPIHCQYLRNMGVCASMSISIIVAGKLWGLIACHHYSPHVVNIETREVALYMSLMLSYLISLKTQSNMEHKDALVRSLNASVTEKMAEHVFYMDGLREEAESLMQMMNATGVAWRLEDSVECFGETPDPERIDALFSWAANGKLGSDSMYSTNSLSLENEKFGDISNLASGVFILSISLTSKLFLIWFRKEIEQTKDWGGKPEKVIEFLDDGSHRLMPRSSFRLWRENVRNKSAAWEPIELSCALKFRNSLVNYVLSKSEKLEKLNEILEQKVTTRTEALQIEITNKEKVQMELKKALSNSEESNRELERFAFVASHDLQEPLRKIQSFGERIQGTETSLSDKGYSYLTKMMSSAERMQTLIKDVLSFSRIHRFDEQFTDFNFDYLFESVLTDLEVLIMEKKPEINKEVIGTIYGNQNQIRRVVQNILQNALKFTKANEKPKVSITVANKELNFVTIEFKDKGVGFDISHQEKIFGLFGRLHSKTEFEGTGLGLAICKKIVSLHSGNIWAQSEKGKGSSFFVKLPCQKYE